MTTSPSVKLALSEAALSLIHHASTDIAHGSAGADRPGRILINAMGASTASETWLRETALLRLISVVEAYVDMVSMYRMTRALDAKQLLVAQLLRDWEVDSTGSWQNRHRAYEEYHSLSLRSLDGWESIRGGIEVRNCVLHGLGNLTAKQRGQTKLPSLVSPIDVSVGSNRMHLNAGTVPALAAGCARFVKALDGAISIPRVSERG